LKGSSGRQGGNNKKTESRDPNGEARGKIRIVKKGQMILAGMGGGEEEHMDLGVVEDLKKNPGKA